MAEQKNQSGLSNPGGDLQARIRQLESQLATANERADMAEARAGQLESEGSSRNYSGPKPVEPATRNKPTWKFKVRCAAKPTTNPPHPDVPDQTINAVDESEAIRQFCLTSKDEKGRQLDPTRYQFQVDCIDPRREANLLEKQRHRRAVALGHEDPRPRGKEHDKSIDTRINPATRQPASAA